MILRLTAVTVLMAGFAVGFSTLADQDDRSFGSLSPSAGCYDQGVVCAPGGRG